VDERLWTVWDEVGRNLTADWTLEVLAKRFCVSK
jgi:hypothetical protein